MGVVGVGEGLSLHVHVSREKGQSLSCWLLPKPLGDVVKNPRTSTVPSRRAGATPAGPWVSQPRFDVLQLETCRASSNQPTARPPAGHSPKVPC